MLRDGADFNTQYFDSSVIQEIIVDLYLGCRYFIHQQIADEPITKNDGSRNNCQFFAVFA